MTAKPMGDYVLVEQIKSDEKTKTGIIMSGVNKSHDIGNVITVGTGLFTQTGDKIPMTCDIGDTVFYHPGGGKDIKLEGKDYKLIRESEMLMVCK